MSKLVSVKNARRRTKRSLEANKENVSEEIPIINRIMNIGTGISRYKIIFLPEENNLDPVKSKLSREEWMKLEMDWCEVEKDLSVSLDNGIDENIGELLKMYDDVISEATSNYHVNLDQIALNLNKSTLIDPITYSFSRDWPREWVQLVYKSFLFCFRVPVNPLHDSSLSEFAYRDRIVNRLIEDIFSDVNNAINMKTGEIENSDRKAQKNSERLPEQKRAIGWSHDALLMIKVNSSDRPVGFGEVVGNACHHDDKKMTEDREKVLKSMQLGLLKLQQTLKDREIDEEKIKKIETYGILVYKKDFNFYVMHYVDGLYLVNKFDEFTIPDNATQFSELSDIIKIMFAFKYRVIKLHLRIRELLKGKCRHRQEPHPIDETVTTASPKKKQRRS